MIRKVNYFAFVVKEGTHKAKQANKNSICISLNFTLVREENNESSHPSTKIEKQKVCH